MWVIFWYFICPWLSVVTVVCLPDCCHSYVERPAFRCHICWVDVHILPATENPSVFEVISRIFPGFLTDPPGHWLVFSSGPSGCFHCLGHYKELRLIDWLIDWLIVETVVTCNYFLTYLLFTYGFSGICSPSTWSELASLIRLWKYPCPICIMHIFANMF